MVRVLSVRVLTNICILCRDLWHGSERKASEGFARSKFYSSHLSQDLLLFCVEVRYPNVEAVGRVFRSSKPRDHFVLKVSGGVGLLILGKVPQDIATRVEHVGDLAVFQIVSKLPQTLIGKKLRSEIISAACIYFRMFPPPLTSRNNSAFCDGFQSLFGFSVIMFMTTVLSA